MTAQNWPTGTVTFLFTDIEGSTRLVQEFGDGYAEVLLEHRRRLRGAFGEHRGFEVDVQGDAFFCSFAKATDAVGAARDGQAALAGGPVRVRMGIHTGEAVLGGEGYVGIDVHRAARICAAGHGGQVLLSDATARLVEVDLHDLGLHRLKDLLAPMRLYQLGHGDFPPLRTLNFANLPVVSTPLVGRETELEEAASVLRECRLVTLVGPGGTGKTWLALQLGADAAGDFADGVFWVPLASIIDPELVEPAIAQAVGVTGGLAGHLAGKRAHAHEPAAAGIRGRGQLPALRGRRAPGPHRSAPGHRDGTPAPRARAQRPPDLGRAGQRHDTLHAAARLFAAWRDLPRGQPRHLRRAGVARVSRRHHGIRRRSGARPHRPV